MTQWLRVHNFRYKKPHVVPAKADLIQQELFTDYYHALKSKLKEDEVIYFGDSSHPQHQTQLAFGWIRKGVRKTVKLTACQKPVNLLGAINLANPNTKTIHLIWDNAGYYKSKEILSFVANTNIKLHYSIFHLE